MNQAASGSKIRITSSISIDERELQWEFVRAHGPGGQKVNKTATAVQLRFDVVNSPSLPEDVRERIHRRLVGVLFSQCFDIVNRGIGTPEDVNIGCQLALGFHKGPFDIMRELGDEETSVIAKKFQNSRPGFPGPEHPINYYESFKRHILIDIVDGVKIITIRRPQRPKTDLWPLIQPLHRMDFLYMFPKEWFLINLFSW